MLHLRAVDSARVEDTRLILVTDLGFIVKRAKDGSRDVFVQSIRTGMPVDGARVEMLGSNGPAGAIAPRPMPADGLGCRSRRRTELRREKTPTLVGCADGHPTCPSCRSASRGR